MDQNREPVWMPAAEETPARPVDSETLRALADAAQESAAFYRRRRCGALSRDAARQARVLRAIGYLWTGEKPARRTLPAGPGTLRAQFWAEQEQARGCRAAAEVLPEHRAALLREASRAEARAEAVRALAAARLM